MKKHQKEEFQSRRNFLRQNACASLGVTGLVNALTQARLIGSAVAADSSPSDYKALICVFLHGGNDSSNMLVPLGAADSSEARADYEAARGPLAHVSEALNPLDLSGGTDAFKKYYGDAVPEMGIHPNAPNIAELFNNGDLSFVCNIGTLVRPIASRSDFLNPLTPKPPQLFSHSDQQNQWQAAVAENPFQSGWGGRVSDLINAGFNGDSSKVSMSISLRGVNSFQTGLSGAVTQYVVNPAGVESLAGYGSNANPYDRSVVGEDNFNSQVYQDNSFGMRMKAFDQIIKLSNESILESEYNKIVVRARQSEGVVGSALAAAAATGVNFDTKFANARHSFGDQLKMICKLIAGQAPLGNRRQVFFCEIRGFDTHSKLLPGHASLMHELSTGLKALRDTLSDPAINMWDNTVAFSASDFGRTLTPNVGTLDAGADHAWAGHALVAGGCVRGKQIFGHFPSLKLGPVEGSIDADNRVSAGRGRLIPDISVDQYSAVLANWFGVDGNSMDAIFPTLNRFDDPFDPMGSANLAFI